MDEVKQLLKKYEERISEIEMKYIVDGIFISDDASFEELSNIEIEYHLLKKLSKALSKLLKEKKIWKR